MHNFSTKSEAQLATCNERLQAVIRLALSWSVVKFEIVQGARTIEQQREYFNAKPQRSKVNPDAYETPAKLYAAAKHIVGEGMPLSRAVDIHAGNQPGGAYDRNALCYVAGVVRGAAQHLGVSIRWGGDFDRDGLLVEPGTFQDLPHFELDE